MRILDIIFVVLFLGLGVYAFYAPLPTNSEFDTWFFYIFAYIILMLPLSALYMGRVWWSDPEFPDTPDGPSRDSEPFKFYTFLLVGFLMDAGLIYVFKLGLHDKLP